MGEKPEGWETVACCASMRISVQIMVACSEISALGRQRQVEHWSLLASEPHQISELHT